MTELKGQPYLKKIKTSTAFGAFTLIFFDGNRFALTDDIPFIL
jgi:hypothetical protein